MNELTAYVVLYGALDYLVNDYSRCYEEEYFGAIDIIKEAMNVLRDEARAKYDEGYL